MSKITLTLAGALAALAIAPPPARAATFGEWLAYCAGGDQTIDAKIKADSMTACGVDEGIKSACSVLSATPWTCSIPAAKPKDKGEQCDSLEIKFEIGGKFDMPGTWKVTGTAKVSYIRYAAKTNINVCNTSPVIPTPNGNGGAYSAESGDISFNVSMKVEGDITVTSPVGISVNLNAKAGCERSTAGHYFKKAEVNSCGTPPPTPPPATPPPATPTPSGTPPPATPPPATPTPSGTPPATPPPATPTPSGTPPSATPPPATPTPSGTPPSATPPPATPTPGGTPPPTVTPARRGASR